MISSAQTLLQEIDVTENDIHSEYFGSPGPQKHTLPSEDESDEVIQVDYLDSRKQVT